MTTRTLVLKTLAKGPRTAQELLSGPLPWGTDPRYLYRVLDDLRRLGQVRSQITETGRAKWELST